MVELRKILEKNNNEYFLKFKHIEENVITVASKFRFFFPEYTNHDTVHLINVENNVNQIISEKILENLNDDEIFCLLSAVWLHDIGMIPFDNEINEYKEKDKKERELFVKEVRDKHHIRSQGYVENHKDKLGLNYVESNIIGNICRGHRKIELDSLSDSNLNNTVRVKSLAAILRLADECDITTKRESQLSIDGIDEDTLNTHYHIHNLVQEIKIDYESNNIEISSIIDKDKDEEILNEKHNKITNELIEIKPFLKLVNINLETVSLNITITKDLLEQRIISCIAQNKGVYSLSNEYITIEDIDERLEILKYSSKYLIDNETLTDDKIKFKEIYKIFPQQSIQDFFYTDYVKQMIIKCFSMIENSFNVYWNNNERLLRMDLLKNSPTALSILLYIDEVTDNRNFNTSSNQNGHLMVDSILLFGIFNDLHQYTDKIDIESIQNKIFNLDILNKDELLSRLNYCKELRRLEK
ncbi:MAG: HD domain-containing protein [Methanosphaera sp.]|nr:HD domain-containing protein [Methanosphaera sp.]